MKRLLEKEYRAYLVIIIILLVVNISFFFIVTRSTTCSYSSIAPECVSRCGLNWAIRDNFFYCSCCCLNQTAITG